MTTMQQPGQKTHGRGREMMTLVVALLVLAYLVINLSSCGNDDLTIPGASPFTDVPDPTDTPDPDA